MKRELDIAVSWEEHLDPQRKDGITFRTERRHAIAECQRSVNARALFAELSKSVGIPAKILSCRYLGVTGDLCKWRIRYDAEFEVKIST